MKTIHATADQPFYPYQFSEEQKNITFFDIETTGLSPKASSLYLIGAIHFNPATSRWDITQWLADDYRSEPLILRAFLDYLEQFSQLYHFNGAAFDIPYVLNKCEKHHLPLSQHGQKLLSPESSVDILKNVRPLKKKLHLVKANQTALEKWLNIHREDAFTGKELISVYTEYMQGNILNREGTDDLEQLLLLHNHDDLLGMLEVTSLLSYTQALSPSAEVPVLSVQEAENGTMLEIQFSLPQPVPRTVTLHQAFPIPQKLPPLSDATLHLSNATGTLSVPIFQGTLKYFFPDYKNYYYLAKEDTAIHKSIAEFVDKEFRQKAAAANCYTKKEGRFLPSLSNKVIHENSPSFYAHYKDKLSFLQLPEETDNGQFWSWYVTRTLLYF